MGPEHAESNRHAGPVALFALALFKLSRQIRLRRRRKDRAANRKRQPANKMTLKRPTRAALRLALALAFFPGVRAALAHAIVRSSVPAEGETVTVPDVPIEIRFNSRIDTKRSRLLLVKPDGGSLVLELAPAAGADILQAKAVGLAPGPYRVHWQTLSVDGHLTQGDVSFRISR